MKIVDRVGASVRINVGEEQRTAFVDLELSDQRITMSQSVAEAAIAALGQMLEVARKIDAEEGAAYGPPAESRFQSELHLTFEVTHEGVDRDELVAVVAARLAGVMRGEGAECHSWSLWGEPSPGDPESTAPDPEH